MPIAQVSSILQPMRAITESKETTMKTYQIACIPGDGIGKEVVPSS